MNGKELNEEEIQKIILSDQNNEIINSYQDKKVLFRMHYYNRVVLNNPMDPKCYFPELYLENVIRTNKEIKFL